VGRRCSGQKLSVAERALMCSKERALLDIVAPALESFESKHAGE
jgi:hypothetical protein